MCITRKREDEIIEVNVGGLRMTMELADEGEFSWTRAWGVLDLGVAIVHRMVARCEFGSDSELEGVQKL